MPRPSAQAALGAPVAVASPPVLDLETVLDLPLGPHLLDEEGERSLCGLVPATAPAALFAAEGALWSCACQECRAAWLAAHNRLELEVAELQLRCAELGVLRRDLGLAVESLRLQYSLQLGVAGDLCEVAVGSDVSRLNLRRHLESVAGRAQDYIDALTGDQVGEARLARCDRAFRRLEVALRAAREACAIGGRGGALTIQDQA